MKYLGKNTLTNIGILFLISVLFVGKISAQGFIKTYPVSSAVNAVTVDQTPTGYCVNASDWSDQVHLLNQHPKSLQTDVDGNQTSLIQSLLPGYHIASGILGCGYFGIADSIILGTGNEPFSVRRLDANGNFLFSDTISALAPGYYHVPISICETTDGNMMVSCSATSWPDVKTFLIKMTPTGQILWTQEIAPNIPNQGRFYAYIMRPTIDNGVMLIGYDNTQTNWAVKVSDIGAVQWAYEFGLGVNNAPSATAADGSTYLATSTGGITPQLHKLDAAGAELWNVNLSTLIGQSNIRVTYVLETPENGCIVTGFHGDQNNLNTFFARINPDGTLAWEKTLWGQGAIQVLNGEQIPGGFIFGGGKGNNIVLIKMDGDGVIYPNAAAGTLVIDANSNCAADAGETGLAGWIVKLTTGGQDYYATTNASGHFELSNLPGGPSYTVVVSATSPSYLWLSCPPVTATMPADVNNYTLPVSLAVQQLADCPIMTLDLGMNPLRKCNANNLITAQYCNNGTALAENVAVEVYLPTEMTFNWSDIPAIVTGQTVRFEVGNVLPGQCGTVLLKTAVNCNTSIGQTLCVDGHVFPDSFCIQSPNWSGACIEANANCTGDSVHLSLRNTTAIPTTQALDYVIIDDDVVMLQGTLPAGFAGMRHIEVPANGGTIRITSQQEPNHPLPGDASAGVEGCQGWHFGFINQFLNQNGNPFSDEVCREIVGSYDPNEKQAYPRGVHNEHFIEPGTPLTYLLHFQNTGTDTAFRVVLRDTLPFWLDPSTVRPGAASHAYTWELKGKGELIFKFDPIALPDSNANLDASNGFVQFAVQMKKDIPLGTVLENRAGIYFDQNAVVLTNTVFHTIGENFLEIVLNTDNNPSSAAQLLTIYPNPASDRVTVSTNAQLSGATQLVLTNTYGKTVLCKTIEQGKTELQRGELPAGVYFIQVIDGKQVAASGKVIWR
ncbi:MAG: T9SS type A sorting domain-containing protein [Bacteroidota bacterium]